MTRLALGLTLAGVLALLPFVSLAQAPTPAPQPTATKPQTAAPTADPYAGNAAPGASSFPLAAAGGVDSKAKDPFWLEKIGIVAVASGNQPAVPVNENFAQIGQPVPDFTLTNQDGKRISIKDFRGKALAITFIYARCPLPDYCIKMSKNFSDLGNQLSADKDAKDKIRLLSISFDPERDTPEKLKEYGTGYLGSAQKPDFTIWQLAVGSDKEVRAIADFFGLQYEVDQNNKAMINHSLVTAVVSPEGKVTKIFKGNIMQLLLNNEKL